MRHLVLGAAVAASFVVLAIPSRADILVLRDRSVLPKKVEANVKAGGGVPSPEDLTESGKNNLDLTYESAKLDGKDISPSQIVDVYITTASQNPQFLDGETNAETGAWPEAAAGFGSAAEELQGLGRQLALYKRVFCLRNVGSSDSDLQEAMTAADEFVAEFTAAKSYWLPPVQEMRARLLMSRGKAEDSVKALQSVSSVAEMNARDLFEAKYQELWLAKAVRATPAQFADVEKSFRSLAEAIEKHPKGRQDAPDQRLKALVRVGRFLALQSKGAEAKQVLRPLADQTDHRIAGRDALAALYVALGDSAFFEAKQASEAGKKDEAKGLAETAALHYLRVTELYHDGADQSDVFNAYQNVAKVFKTLFSLSGDKDCEVGRRAYDYFVAAVGMLGDGEEKRALVREGMALKDSLAKSCPN